MLLILGLFTGIAAFLGGLLTMSFGLAGSAGVNPMFFLFEVLLILAWRNAGYVGLDRWVLPALGTPWEPGRCGAASPGSARPNAARPETGPGYTPSAPRSASASSATITRRDPEAT